LLGIEPAPPVRESRRTARSQNSGGNFPRTGQRGFATVDTTLQIGVNPEEVVVKVKELADVAACETEVEEDEDEEEVD
jgi:hypothetical protein